MRVGHELLLEEIPRNNELIVIFPTGYGKTSFFQHNAHLIERMGKTVHVLPLQSIVHDLFTKMSKVEVLKNKVGYQMHMSITKEGKRPFLSKKYMITTIDSYSLNFYGIPVYEIYRSRWHSDIAFLFARTSHLILDEFHLITALDVEDAETEYAKVVSVAEHIFKSLSNRLRIIMTATLSPSLIKRFDARTIVLAPNSHPYVQKLREFNVRTLNIWNMNDDFISEFSDYTDKVKTYLVYVDDLFSAIKKIVNDEEGKILIILNHAKRVEETAEKLNLPFIHGLFGDESKLKATILLTKVDKIITSQVVEAGVDIDFDVLITDIAPAYSLIQRVGRISRKKLRCSKVYILVDKNNLEKQIKGVYSITLTNETLRELEKAVIGEESFSQFKIKRVNINWRLPDEKANIDYLKLVLSIDSGTINIMKNTEKSIKNTLDFLSKIVSTPEKVVGVIDDVFEGSFIRSTALIPIVINDETVNISWDRFKLLAAKLKNILSFRFLVRGHDGETYEDEIKDIHVYGSPLSLLRYTVNQARRKVKAYDEELSGYVEIIGKGFICPNDFVGKMKINGEVCNYLRVSKIVG